MTIVELPNELPGWGLQRIDGERSMSFWVEDISIEVLQYRKGWGLAVKQDGQLNIFLYPDAIRRK